MQPFTVVLDEKLAQDPKKPRDVDMARELIGHDEKQKLVRSFIQGEVLHRNYLGYLETAWANHLGVVLTPDVFWYTLLCESTLMIRENVEPLRRFFTKSPGKTDIVVNTSDITHLPMEAIIEELKVRVPDGNAQHFLPDFSQSDDAARFARYAAFADAVSPYYNYMTLACGIPAIRVEGSAEDWDKLAACWTELSKIFMTIPKLKVYCLRVAVIAHTILTQYTIRPDEKFLKGIFRLQRCGSGGDQDAHGWFTDLFRIQPRTRRVGNFSSHISKVDYANLDTGRKFTAMAGCFGSTLEGGFLVPKFGQAVVENLK
jgi:hypothetical protein